MNEQPEDNFTAPTVSANQPMKKSTLVAIVFVVLIVAGGGGFFGGMQYEKKKLQDNPAEIFGAIRGNNTNGSVRQFGNPNGGSTNRAFPGGMGRGVSGTIESISGTTMTVKSVDGSSKIVILPSSASITKSATGSAADLVTGETVMVTGTTNDDGSVTAVNIQLNPTMPTGAPPTDAGTSSST